MKGTIVFDFDSTLFDAARLKEAMAASLSACGVAPENFWRTYEQTSKTSDKICDYDPERHVASLKGSLTCAKEEALRRIDAVVDRSPEFLMPGAVSLLQRLRTAGADLVLLTHGNVHWQKRKTARSGLLPHFSKALFAAGEKVKFEELAALRPPVTMVNDNGQEIDALQKAYPDFRMVAVRGPKPPPSDPAVPVCVDLEEVYKVLIGGLQ